MMKVLKSYTIIPPNLYVHRDADRQLQNIIADMGRPGYVLVSRQMGKTNLLLNAKRELQNDENVFVYIDLSNPFSTSKLCFENIIDTAYETNRDLFSAVYAKIKQERNSLGQTPPHKQHLNELRTLLKSFNGKIVIILDEIDALTKTKYSDEVFSQIRSVYFNRTNFTELENLTYILSGVIEPADIIRDPKVSPFNIGQKIFLNDFSKEEFNHFISLAQLQLNADAKERIFSWTRGNPRMTWDICSEVENELSNNIQIEASSIDKIITNLYLTTFDKPPIDHIRELVKDDRELRNALVEIQFNKQKEISQKIKNKLYLAGIINYEDNKIKIKNKIIETSLDINWIRKIEEEEKGLVAIAMDYYSKNEYRLALENFEKFLQSSDFADTPDRPHYYFIMGHSSYKLLNFQKALQFLEKADFDKNDEAKWYYRTLHLKGICLIYLDKYQESIFYFKTVIESGRRDDVYLRSLFNYGTALLKLDNPIDQEEALLIFKTIVEEKKQDIKASEEFYKELKSIGHFNLAQIFIRQNNIPLAKENFEKAITYASDNSKAFIILQFLKIIDKSERFDLLSKLTDLIIENKLTIHNNDPENPYLFSIDQFKEIIVYVFIEFDDLYKKLEHKFDLLGDESLSLKLFDLAFYSTNVDNTWKACRKFLKLLHENFNSEKYEFENVVKFNVLKYLAYLDDDTTNINYHLEYVDEISKDHKIDNIDFENFASIIFRLSERKRFTEALKCTSLIESFKNNVDNNLLINYLVIYHLELNIYVELGDQSKVKTIAKTISDLADSSVIKNQDSNLLGDTGLEIIKQNAKKILNPNAYKKVPIRIEKKYGRNEIVKVRYRDGSIREAKFKNVEEQIKNGNCFILN